VARIGSAKPPRKKKRRDTPRSRPQSTISCSVRASPDEQLTKPVATRAVLLAHSGERCSARGVVVGQWNPYWGSDACVLEELAGAGLGDAKRDCEDTAVARHTRSAGVGASALKQRQKGRLAGPHARQPRTAPSAGPARPRVCGHGSRDPDATWPSASALGRGGQTGCLSPAGITFSSPQHVVRAVRRRPECKTREAGGLARKPGDRPRWCSSTSQARHHDAPALRAFPAWAGWLMPFRNGLGRPRVRGRAAFGRDAWHDGARRGDERGSVRRLRRAGWCDAAGGRCGRDGTVQHQRWAAVGGRSSERVDRWRNCTLQSGLHPIDS